MVALMATGGDSGKGNTPDPDQPVMRDTPPNKKRGKPDPRKRALWEDIDSITASGEERGKTEETSLE